MVKKLEHSFVAGATRQASSPLRLASEALHPAYSTRVERRTGGGCKTYGLADTTRIHHRDCRSGTAVAQRVLGDGKPDSPSPDSQVACVSATASGRHWRRSARSWGSTLWRPWRVSSLLTPFSPGTANWWPRNLMAPYSARPPVALLIDQEMEALVVRMARENRSWGYDRIVGALANLGYTISDQTVGNILKRHGIPPAPVRKTTTTWIEFIRTHLDVLVATDFFTAEVWTLGWVSDVLRTVFHTLGQPKSPCSWRDAPSQCGVDECR